MNLKQLRNNLNEQQFYAASRKEGVYLVLSGAGSGKCVDPSTLILTSEGIIPIVRVPDVYKMNGDNECTAKTVTVTAAGKHKKVKTSHWYNMGKSEVLQVTTESGYTLVGTPENPIRSLTKEGDIEFVRLENIKPGDYVPLAVNTEIWSKENKVNENVAIIMGYLVANGSSQSKNRIDFSESEPQYYEEYKHLLYKEFGIAKERIKSVRKKDSKTHDHSVVDEKAFSFLQKNGLKLKGSSSQVIPHAVLESKREVVIAFLQAYFDLEACISGRAIEWVTASLRLAKQLQVVLLNLGIRVAVKVKKVKGYEQNYYRCFISGNALRTFHDKIGFRKNYKAKQELEYPCTKDTNTNVETYPNQCDRLRHIRATYFKGAEFWDSAAQSLPFGSIKDYFSGKRKPSAKALDKILAYLPEGTQDKEVKYLQNISQNLIFERVKFVKKAKPREVYDFTVPSEESFIANGFLNHNTRTLTYRVAHLIHKGVDPNQILLLTFTRKAAKEMTDRANKLLGTSKLKIASGTFHSIAMQFILKYKNELGYTSSPTILDTDDAKDLIELVKNKVVEKNKFFPNKGALYNIFSKASNTQSSIAAVILENYKTFEGLTSKIEDVYVKYCAYKREKGLLDFDDLLEQFDELLSVPKVKKIFSKMFKYIMVDEFQDTNNIQFSIVKKLAVQGNLMVVGDDAQCWEESCVVKTKEGKKKVKDLQVGDDVECIYQGKVCFKPITNITCEGKTNTVKITTETGKVIELSERHKCFTTVPVIKTSGDVVSIDFNKGLNLHHVTVSFKGNEYGFDSYKEALAFAEDLQIKFDVDCVERFHTTNAGSNITGPVLYTIESSDIRINSYISVQDNNSISVERVAKIESSKGIVYDIEVETAGNLVANDIISHNSCYMFRGANFKNIIDFPKQFKNCETIVITQNYRSTNQILDFTNAIMEPAKEKFEKELFSEIKGKSKPKYVIANDEAQQAHYVGNEIERLIGKGVKPNEIAVLFRASKASVYIEPEIVGRGLKFIKYGGMSFIDSAHIKDIVALYRVCISKHDPIAWHRALAMLPKVGAKTSSTFINQLVDEGKKYSVLNSPLTANLYELITKVRKHPPTEVEKITKIIFDYYLPFFNKKYNNSEWRRNDLNAFKKLALNYESIKKLINYLTIDPNDSKDKDTDGKVILSTIHSAKGLEYKIVFLVNLVEDGLPSSMCKNDEEIEEERRLFYIATTRAKTRLYMIAPFGKDVNKESRFVKEIKNFKEHVEVINLTRTSSTDDFEERPNMNFFKSKVDITRPPWE